VCLLFGPIDYNQIPPGTPLSCLSNFGHGLNVSFGSFSQTIASVCGAQRSHWSFQFSTLPIGPPLPPNLDLSTCTGLIRVTSATYGANQVPVPPNPPPPNDTCATGNMTAWVGISCDGQRTCDFQVQQLDTFYDCYPNHPKDLQITYDCLGGGPTGRTASLPAGSTAPTIPLDCPQSSE
jgi:hypothetical protein